MSNLTDEQSLVVTTILQADTKLVAVPAVSGSGKTHLLTEVAKNFNSGIYLAYNKAVATEARAKFPKTIICSTTHSLAYQNTVKPFKLKVGWFSYRDIQKRMPFEKKIAVIEALRNYCLSEYISFNDYAQYAQLQPMVKEVTKEYLSKMKQGTIECTHDFYLKYYHILLSSGSVKHDTFGIVMLDEAGDLNPVTLEIFKLLPATKKIMVGDSKQNIYAFNNTINGFKAMANVGTTLALSQSFRVDAQIASDVERFCQSYIDKDMIFKGQNYSEAQKSEIVTSAFISRTNGTLIGEMIELNNTSTPYGLARKAATIFELPLGLITLSSKGFIKLPQYKFLEHDYNDYIGSPRLQDMFSSFYSYVSSIHSDDVSVKSATALIMNHGPRTIIQTFEAAKSHEGGNHNHILATGHSVKGLEYDSVYIADDMNEKTSKVLISKDYIKYGVDGITDEEVGELNLYYVACTRAKYELLNAKLLDAAYGDTLEPRDLDTEFNIQMQEEIKSLQDDIQF